jgi:methionine biosynthesis protein MetW
MMSKLPDKRTVEMRVIGDWVEPRSRVLDLGCGRGVLLEYLVQTKQIFAVGVDYDPAKIAACVKRGLTAYQGDLEGFLRAFPDGHFDRVICSRTLEELAHPHAVITEALRVGRRMTVGFVNHGFWKNRLATLVHGRKPHNDVYPTPWAESRPANPVSVADFDAYCAGAGLVVHRRALLRGDWQTPCALLPNLLAGYAVYEIGSSRPDPIGSTRG